MAFIGIRFDLRVPPFAATTHADQYAACLDQCAWADQLGLDLVVLSEHHGVADGYLPAPLTLAAAIAGRTQRIRISIAAALVPLHDPVRMAEQLAVIDLASGSRVSLVAGLGYRQEEFEMAGVDRTQRGRLLEEYVGVMRQAWTGEPFEWRGRTVRVTPKPAVPPMVLVGGSTPVAARRAARLRAGFFPSIGDPKLAEIYNAECQRVGFTDGFVSLPNGPGFVHVSDDPERDWARIAPHALYDAQTYAAWQTPDQRSSVHVEAQTIEDVRRSGVYRVVTPDECVALAQETGRIILHPLMGGMSPELGWEGLRLFESKVLPRLR
ncbi:MAG TPA: LLM class flavin-dependent oxidoreductase [Candidatus Acidoferrales bacterium]|nr:LLM class flavin-dependent oxidoreductase [Candidatus Acidoferrales bacterium]